ncbi:hypothetical protein V500_10069, partial [Pseudogymnoascus sp. VKM F-4518 (FW-2643)]
MNAESNNRPTMAQRQNGIIPHEYPRPGFNGWQQPLQPDQVLKSDNRPTMAQRQDGIIPRSIIATDPVSSNPGGTNGPSTAPFQQAVPAQHTQLAKRPAASRTQFSSPNEWRLGDEVFDPNAQAMQRQTPPFVWKLG